MDFAIFEIFVVQYNLIKTIHFRIFSEKFNRLLITGPVILELRPLHLVEQLFSYN